VGVGLSGTAKKKWRSLEENGIVEARFNAYDKVIYYDLHMFIINIA
jgi:hypothetical protein